MQEAYPHLHDRRIAIRIYTAVGNQTLEVRRQQSPQGCDDHRSGHLGAGYKEWQFNALTTTGIGDD
jgi:hypothetical protein